MQFTLTRPLVKIDLINKMDIVITLVTGEKLKITKP